MHLKKWRCNILIKIQDIVNSFSDENSNLENFFKHIQANFDDIIKKTNEIQENILNHKNEITATLTQIELELKNNQGIFEKWVSGENNKLKQEQISQKKIWLLESHRVMHDKVNQFLLDIDKNIKDFNTASQQFIIDYKNIENQIKAYTQQMADFNRDVNHVSQNDAVNNVNHALQQAVDALNTVKNGLDQRKVFEEIKKSIENIIE